MNFNVVEFVGGALDGVCWPCCLAPEVLAVRTSGGTLHVYECDLSEPYGDGTFRLRMVPARVVGDAMEELTGGWA